MPNRTSRGAVAAAVLAILIASAPLPTAAQVCAPDPNGRVAEVFYEDTVIFWEPVVEYEEMVLTVGGPCEDIVKVFRSGEQIFFDLREIERITDGAYTWELRRKANIDPGTKKALDESRQSGDDSIWWSLFQQGAIPAGPYVDSESFTVDRGVIVPPSGGEKSGAVAELDGAGPAANASPARAARAAGFSEAAGDGTGGSPTLATRATVLTNADGVIRNSLCVGFDCPNNPSFSDTTILLMENNTRIKFDDTSTINSFPRNDWEIEANSNLNGGASYLGFNDCGQSSQGGCATDLVFAVEAGARQNALYVEADSDVGFGTANPVVRLHAVDGDTPALRLEQDGSSGFAPQTWDVAGNETNFFIRDATGGSQLPFRIQPGADSNSLFIESTNDVGIGTSAPDAELHVRRTDASRTEIRVENANAAAQAAAFRMQNSSRTWEFQADTVGNVLFRDVTQNSNPFVIEPAVTNEVIRIDSGNGGRVGIRTGNNVNFTLEVNGTIGVTGTGQVHPDYVFGPDYQLESIEEHTAYMFQHKHLPAVGAGQYDAEGRAVIDLGSRSQGMLEELEKAHIYISQLHQEMTTLLERIDDLETLVNGGAQP